MPDSLPHIVPPHVPNQTLLQHIRLYKASVVDSLEHHGAILFRGWNINGPDEFADVTHALSEEHDIRLDIACSAGPRLEIVPGVFTSNEAPPSEDIPVHHEMAQCDDPPKYVCFFCEVPSPEGGCTPLVRSQDIACDLRSRFPDVAQRIHEKGVRYVREFPATTDMTSPLGKSWGDTFRVNTRVDAEKELTRLGYEWSWSSNDDVSSRLRTIGHPRPVLIGDSSTGMEVLFTAAESVFVPPRPNRPEKSFVFGDGTPLDDECVHAFRSVGQRAFSEAHRFIWQSGDVLILNNETVMHARDPFTPPRRILVSLLGHIHGGHPYANVEDAHRVEKNYSESDDTFIRFCDHSIKTMV